MNKLSLQKRVNILSCLVEGNSIRSTVRMTGASKNTVTKLLVDIGRACETYQDKIFQNLNCKKIQCDEIWTFCYSKEKNVPQEHRGKIGYGDVYTWVAIDAKSKLVLSFLVGKRDAQYGQVFINDLSSRLSNRVQLTTDGHKVYLQAVENAFGSEIDYAMLVKIYGSPQGINDARRYSPAGYTGATTIRVSGKPVMDDISTSFVERQNLTMRMGMRRFTRLTNAFSKKFENLKCAVALHFMHYNFARIHSSLRISPAMASGIEERLWNIEDVVRLID